MGIFLPRCRRGRGGHVELERERHGHIGRRHGQSRALALHVAAVDAAVLLPESAAAPVESVTDMTDDEPALEPASAQSEDSAAAAKQVFAKWA